MTRQGPITDGWDQVDLTAFWDDGYAVLGPLVDEAELDLLRRVYDCAIEEGMGHELPGRDGRRPTSLRQVLKPEERFPELWGTAYFERGRQIAAHLLELPAEDMAAYSHMTYKPPRHGRDTPWHQDEAYWSYVADPGVRARSVTIWLTLDDATLASGCMHFIPGSHHRLERHRFVDDESSALTVVDPDIARARAHPMGPGEASVHCSRTIHHAGPNRTGHPRRAWALELHGPRAPEPGRTRNEADWLPELARRLDARTQLGLI